VVAASEAPAALITAIPPGVLRFNVVPEVSKIKPVLELSFRPLTSIYPLESVLTRLDTSPESVIPVIAYVPVPVLVTAPLVENRESNPPLTTCPAVSSLGYVAHQLGYLI
jgi:hypothetical protein